MSKRENLYRKIKAELERANGLKARKIARLIAEDKKEINRILYKSEYSGMFRRDDMFVWYLVDSKDGKPCTNNSKTQITGASKVSNCKSCMLYKNGECIGARGICDFYKHSPYISAEEMQLWPKEMSGPYGTLHK